MKAFSTLLISNIKMLLRNRVFLISSLGIAVISIFAFGWLFGSQNDLSLTLSVVNQDSSQASQQVIQQLRENKAIHLYTEKQDEALEQLRSGHRDAVIVMGPDFGASLQQQRAQMKVYYNQSSPSTLAITRQAVQSIVEGMNRNITKTAPALTLQEQAVSARNLRLIDFVLPGMLGVMLMWTNLNAGSSLVDLRERGTLKRLAATPLNAITFISTQMVARLILSILQALVLLALGLYIFNVQIVGNLGLLLCVVALGTLTMLAIGFAIGSFARNADTAQSISFLVSFPMMFLSGSYFSISNAPDFLKPLINILPLTYISNALRQIMNNGASIGAIQTDLLVLCAWAVAGFLLSTRTFRWTH